MKITKTHKNASIKSVVDGVVTIITDAPYGIYVYYDAALKSIKDGTIVVEYDKPFTVSDLKTGMIVQYRNGNKRMFIDTIHGGVFTYRNDYMAVSSYNDDFNCISLGGDREFDIVKVWNHPKNTVAIDSAIEYPGELLWQRK